MAAIFLQMFPPVVRKSKCIFKTCKKQETFGVPKMKFADARTERLKTHNTGTFPGKQGRAGCVTVDKV